MNKDKRFFKVKYGFGALDYVSIEEGGELEKAIYAQITGNPTQIGSAYINGRNIISISPHYHKHTGWNEFYEPNDGDDWVQIKIDCPNYDGVIEKYKTRVAYLMQNNQVNQIGKGLIITELDKPKNNPELEKITKTLANKFQV
jgi:hypothetical protein